MKGVALLVVCAFMNSAQSHAAPAVVTQAVASPAAPVAVEVRGAKVRSADLFGGGVADVELGATPPLGASRVIDRAEIERAFAAANAAMPKKVAQTYRVTRKTKKLTTNDVATAVRANLGSRPMPRGATISNIRASAVEVAGDFQRVDVELAPLPRRAGAVTVQARVTFLGDEEAPLFKTLVPVELLLPPEAAFPEIARGAPISVVVKKGLVEVSVPGVAAADADVGSFLPVTLKPSGRVLRARAIDKDHAVVSEDS